MCRGFSNWKDATVGFKSHELSACHREAVEMVINLPSSTKHIGAILSKQYEMQMAQNRKMLLKILSSIRFLARQALSLRGHHNDCDGNLIQLLKLQGGEDGEMLKWLEKKTNKYTSPEVQNELLTLMATHILRSLSDKLQSSPFISIMIDETTDVTNQEQVTIVMRRIEDDFEVYEEFLGLYAVPSIDAVHLFSVIKDCMLRFNLPLSKLRGQCYDGCSTMSGIRSGVAKRVQDEESRAVFTHCYSHSLNLAASDSVKKSQFMKSALETTHEITKLIKKSPRRNEIFKELKAESDHSSDSSSVHVKLLCPTRWTVRADSLFSIIDNYSVLLSTWETASQIARDTESKARIQGVSSQMNTFNFLFGTYLGELVLRHTDNLSKTLQHRSLCAAEGQIMADMVTRTIEKLRDDLSFDMFWLKVLKMSESLDMEPQLPRQRKRPRRCEDGLADAEFHSDVKAYFRQHYFEAIDLIINCIKDRFQQPGYIVYSHLEQLLLKAAENKDIKEELEFVCKFYEDDLDQENLKAQLFTFGIEFQLTRGDSSTPNDIFDIKNYFCSLTGAQRSLLSQVCRVLQLILIMPATNATSERSFSALRRVQTYLRNTMTQKRLNNLMLLHVHRDDTDKLDLNAVASDYIGDSEYRLKIFGRFQ